MTTCPHCRLPVGSRGEPDYRFDRGLEPKVYKDRTYHHCCVVQAQEPEIDDKIYCCPECEKPNQLGEVCPVCERALQREADIEEGIMRDYDPQV